jgi:glycosyltransferase involved in cell wall biosynthesis
MSGLRVFLSTVEPASGAAQYVKSLAIALHPTGAQVALLCPANYAYKDELTDAGVEVIAAGYRSTVPAGLCTRISRNIRYAMIAAGSHLRAARSHDVFHFQFLPHLPLGFFFVLMAVWKGCPVVLTAHDPIPHRWMYPFGLRRLERWMLKWTYRMSRMVIVHNESGSRLIRREFGAPAERIVVIPHGPLFQTQGPPLCLLRIASSCWFLGRFVKTRASTWLCRRSSRSTPATRLPWN